jgi:hypothetical protein
MVRETTHSLRLCPRIDKCQADIPHSGGRIRSKTETAQVNEVLCKILAHNLCVLVQSIYELGIEAKFWHKESAA